MKIIIKLFLIFLISKVYSFSIDENEWKSLTESDYSVGYPTAWTLDESGKMGTSFIILSPSSSENDPFKENVNLLIQDLSGLNLTLDKYVEISEGQIKKMSSNISEKSKITDGKYNYYKFVYSGKQGDLDLKFEQRYYVVDDKAYVLTLTCETEQFDSFKEVGEKILSSFKLK